MFSLIGCAVCSAASTLIIKFFQTRGWSLKALPLINYFTAAIACCGLAAKDSVFQAFSGFSMADAVSGLKQLDGNVNASAGILIAILFGAAIGLLFLVSYTWQQRCIQRNGAGMTSMFISISFILPLLCAMVLWDEIPKYYQWIGIAGVLAAIILTSTTTGKLKINPVLLCQLLLSGLVSLMMKAYAVYGAPEFAQLFYLSAYIVAIFAYSVYLFVRWRKDRAPLGIHGGILLVGAIQGLIIAGWGIITQSALTAFPANIVYPTQGAGGMAIVALVSLTAFREQLGRKQITAIVLSMACLVLVNLSI